MHKNDVIRFPLHIKWSSFFIYFGYDNIFRNNKSVKQLSWKRLNINGNYGVNKYAHMHVYL